jgi:putative transposase
MEGEQSYLDVDTASDDGLAALAGASVVVVVGTSATNLLSQWVRYEWDGFFNDILSGVKPSGRVFAYTEGMRAADLPRGLPQTQCFDHQRYGIDAVRSFITNALHGGVSNLRPPSGNGPPVAKSPAIHVVEAPVTSPSFEIDAVALEEDHQGDVLETFVTKRRDRKAALRFLNKAMKRYGNPLEIVTDHLRSYRAAMKELGNQARQVTGRWLNNRAEISHQPFRRREWAMAKFRSAKSLQKFASVHSSLHNHFNQERHLYNRQTFKLHRAAALAQWRQLTA